MRFAVIGAGSWGSALALHLAHSGHEVTLWARDAKHVSAMRSVGENSAYLPGCAFPQTLHVTADLGDAVTSSDVIMVATPSHVFEEILTSIKAVVSSQVILSVTKGLTSDGGMLSGVALRILPNNDYALLSGPSFATEVAKQMPTAVIIASDKADCAMRLVKAFSHNYFRAYASDDLLGVQIGGAVKNVLAVACGISDGMGFGANARAGLITRGLSEMMRLGAALGAQPKTLMGLSGMGDLVLTCTDDQSRNRRFGLAIGQGKNLQQAQKSIGQVIESATTTQQVKTLAKTHHVDMPITLQIDAILNGGVAPEIAVEALFSRELKSE
jgi:glycerol-3-phosphate dehydrogenase (NAD(P)+)